MSNSGPLDIHHTIPISYVPGGKRTASQRDLDIYNCCISPKYFSYSVSDVPERSPCTPESAVDLYDMATSSSGGAVALPADTGHCDSCKNGLTIMIIDQPEENYRARYESEGCRGPMKGRNGGCPTIMVMSQDSGRKVNAHVSVELTAIDGTPLQTCRLDNNEDGSNLYKTIQTGEKASFDNLRIRRLKKTDFPPCIKSKPTGRGKQDEKQAHLLFTATIQVTDCDKPIILKTLSKPIYLNANHDPPEIHRIVPTYGTANESIAIIGTRMHSPRVSFIVNNQDGHEKEIPADYEKEVSHQNALVVKVPAIPAYLFGSNGHVLQVHIRVTAGKGDRTGREPLRSQPMGFTYVKQGQCTSCTLNQYHFQATPQIMSMTYGGPHFGGKPNSPLGHATPPSVTMATNPTPMMESTEEVDDILEVLTSPSQDSPVGYSSFQYNQVGGASPPYINQTLFMSDPAPPPQVNEFERYLPPLGGNTSPIVTHTGGTTVGHVPSISMSFTPPISIPVPISHAHPINIYSSTSSTMGPGPSTVTVSHAHTSVPGHTMGYYSGTPHLQRYNHQQNS